ncbi:MarR family transcriptional regulator [uncultured Sphingomonas sp.]|uniref:MarR family winged helix-turn-helix transcriptional regulator n=1 Tax=uncultured Sphingomonas sp. TaxID=158754 RepID=UPI0025FFB789|nr:MarR family transcriptional regulator [uncultured Sphingomonas sp.]
MTEPVTIDDDLGALLHRAAALVAQRLSERLSDHGVTRAEWVLLALLHAEGAVPPSLLAARLGFTRGAVTKLIDRLRAKRFVVRTRAGHVDRRYQTIALTGAGAVLVPRLRAVVAACDAEVFGRLAREDHKVLERSLRCLLDPADPCSRD